MSPDSLSLPEPLQFFDAQAPALAPLLARVDDLAARFRAERSAGRVLPNTLEALRIELTYHSNAIEGSTLSLRETQLVIEGKAPAGEKDLREIYEARNHDRALRLIEKWATERPDAPLTERDILDVHAQVLADIQPAAAGRFREGRVFIAGTGFVPPGSHKFDVLLPRLIGLANQPGRNPVIQAAELHYNLAAVHPFADGNGRTARLTMNHALLRRGYPYAIIEVNRRGEYLKALDEANRGRTGDFAWFIADSVRLTAEKLLIA